LPSSFLLIPAIVLPFHEAGLFWMRMCTYFTYLKLICTYLQGIHVRLRRVGVITRSPYWDPLLLTDRHRDPRDVHRARCPTPFSVPRGKTPRYCKDYFLGPCGILRPSRTMSAESPIEPLVRHIVQPCLLSVQGSREEMVIGNCETSIYCTSLKDTIRGGGEGWDNE
jgi:hypothetical protein